MRNGSRWICAGAILCVLMGLSAVRSSAEDIIWARISFAEIGSASPVVGMATAPVSLLGAIVKATPKKYIEEVKGDGFDLNAIFQAVDAMPVNETFKIHKDDYQLEIEKYRAEDGGARPGLLVIRSPDLNVPVPLATTGIAVSLLQFTLKDLQGLDAELSTMLEELKKTPPGIMLKGEDKLMNSWLELRLQ